MGSTKELLTWSGQMPGLPNLPHFAMGFGNGSIVDKIPADMLFLVDRHWNQFPPLDTLTYMILGVFIIVAGMISVIGNGMVMYIFLTTRTLRTPSNLLVINLAFSDFLMMFGMFPFMAVSSFYEVWAFGPLACQIYGFVGNLSGCMSIWSLAMIAIDRYNVIVRGISAQPMTYCRAAGYIAYANISSLAWCIVPLFGWGRYVPEGNMTVCGTDSVSDDWNNKSYVVIYSVWVYFVPLFIFIFCYSAIVRAVANHEHQMREQAKKMNVQSLRSADSNKASAEIKLAKIALMTITLWFIAWTPYLVINIQGQIDKNSVTPLFTVWGSVFAKCAAVYNPIVYGISHPKYRTALAERFPWMVCGSTKNDDTVSNATTEGSTTEKGDEEENKV